MGMLIYKVWGLPFLNGITVRNVLENPELMEKLTQIGSEEMQELNDLKLKKFQIEKILDDPVFKSQVLYMKSDVPK